MIVFTIVTTVTAVTTVKNTFSVLTHLTTDMMFEGQRFEIFAMFFLLRLHDFFVEDV